MHKNMMYAHVMASLGSKGFYLDVSKPAPELASSDDSARLALDKLNAVQILALKNMAHDQYINAMLMGASDLESHRATLNFMSRMVQRHGATQDNDVTQGTGSLLASSTQLRAPQNPRRKRAAGVKKAA